MLAQWMIVRNSFKVSQNHSKYISELLIRLIHKAKTCTLDVLGPLAKFFNKLGEKLDEIA